MEAGGVEGRTTWFIGRVGCDEDILVECSRQKWEGVCGCVMVVGGFRFLNEGCWICAKTSREGLGLDKWVGGRDCWFCLAVVMAMQRGIGWALWTDG